MDVDASLMAASPAPSASQAPPTKRGVRGPYKKNVNHTGAENIDSDGRLPGSKDGLSAFPPGSDWAKLMLALKRKGEQGCSPIRFLFTNGLMVRQTISHQERKT